MLKLQKMRFILALALLSFSNAAFAATDLEIGVVNFRKCVEQSKLGKEQQGNFEQLKEQMEKVLGEKEKVLNEMSNKFNDSDFMDSLSEQAEEEMKTKFRALTQELTQHQSQYYQMLNQANFQIIQQIQQAISQAAQKVGKQKDLKLIINEESAFYYDPALDISDAIVLTMDQLYAEKE